MLLNILTIIFLLLILLCIYNPTNIEGLSSSDAGTMAGELPLYKNHMKKIKKRLKN